MVKGFADGVVGRGGLDAKREMVAGGEVDAAGFNPFRVKLDFGDANPG